MCKITPLFIFFIHYFLSDRMILRFINYVESGDSVIPAVLLYMVLHVITFAEIFIANAHMHAQNSDVFNKYYRIQVIIYIACVIMLN